MIMIKQDNATATATPAIPSKANSPRRQEEKPGSAKGKRGEKSPMGMIGPSIDE